MRKEKRASRRIAANLPVKFSCGDTQQSGYLVDFSETGMFMRTGINLPAVSNFEVRICSSETEFKVPVKFCRVASRYGLFESIGVEVLSPSREYLDLLDSFREKRDVLLNLRIDDEVIRRTTKCPRNFRCLTKSIDVCLVDRPVNGEGVYILEVGNQYKGCPYAVALQDCYICGCPTRYAIYEKYDL